MSPFFTALFSCCDKSSSSSNSNSRRIAKSEAAGIDNYDNEERRNVRVRSIRSNTSTNLSANSGIATSLPPRYEDLFDHSDASGRNAEINWGSDEKDPRIFVDDSHDSSTGGLDEVEEGERGREHTPIAIQIRRSSTTTDLLTFESNSDMDGDGDGSSIVSIPSTRLSGLTSSYTGATVRTTENRFSFAGSRAGDFEFVDNQSAPPSYYAGSVSVGGEMDAEDEGDREGHPVLSEGWLERLRLHAERNVREGRGG